jgi:hypothetical protein
MVNYFPIEFLGIFTVFYIIYKTKFQKYIIPLLFRKQSIYLPLNDKYLNEQKKLIKEYKHKKEGKFIIWTCEIDEFCEKTKSSKYIDFDFLVYLYLCNFIILIAGIIYKLLNFFVIVKRGTPFFSNESDSTSSNIDYSIYFGISFIIFIIYNELTKYISSYKSFSKASKEFLICFFICFILFFVNESYNEKLFRINYESACDVLNERLELILNKANVKSNFVIDSIYVKIFYSFIFGLISGIFLRSSQRAAYFDNFFCNLPYSSQVTNAQSYSTENGQKIEKSTEYIFKIKSIINLSSLILLIEPLLDNFLEIINFHNIIK